MQPGLNVSYSAVLAVDAADEIPEHAPDGAIYLIAPTLTVVQKRDGELVGEDGTGPLTLPAALDWRPDGYSE